jgi:hypothetical protein
MNDKVELFENIEFIKVIKDKYKYNNIELVGGAVIDILENRIPKDYDVVGFNVSEFKKLKDLGFEFKYDSKTATTFYFGDKIIQFLKTTKDTFDYTISQSSYSLSSNSLTIDELSFNSKLLIPTIHTWENKGKSLNALKRTINYAKKGYSLPEETFISLLNNVSTKGGVNS